MYTAEVESFTHKCKNQVIVAKKFLSEDDHVLIIDDYLANGCALQGLIQIDKAFHRGVTEIRNLVYHLESRAIVEGMDASTGEITFREQ